MEDTSKHGLIQNSVVDVSDTEPRQINGRVLHLYSGPHRPSDGRGKHLEDHAREAAYVDREINELHDLLDQDIWEKIELNLPMYDCYMISPPCSTLLPARQGQGGPQPLGSTEGPEVYGLTSLTAEDMQKAREGNILALRGHPTASPARRRGKPWLLEQPHEREEKTSMLKLDEYKDLIATEGVFRYTSAQCRFGAPSGKLTDLLSDIEGLTEFTILCNHPKQWWRVPWGGRWIFATHPPLKDKQRAIQADQWRPSMLRSREPQRECLTRQAAAYPDELNRALATALATAIIRVRSKQGTTDRLDNKRTATINDERDSLRNVPHWITDRMECIGVQVCNIIGRHLDDDEGAEDQLWHNLAHHQSQEDVIVPEQAISLMRRDIKEMLIRNSSGRLPTDLSVDTVSDNGCATVIRAYLWEAWARVVGDPASGVVTWLYRGAPAGLTMHSESLDGVFPVVDADTEQLDIHSLATDFDSSHNYVGVEDDEEALETLESHRQKGYLSRYDSIEELVTVLGDEPVSSRLACLEKLKYNLDTGQYISKSRIILDCKRSGVSLTSVRTHKSVLPRTTDAVSSSLELFDNVTEGHEFTMFIAGIVDAFWLITCGTSDICSNHGFEITWIQSISDDFRLQTDDHLVITKGTQHRIRRRAVVFAAAWQIMGFPLAFHKATLAHKLTWIGVQLEILSGAIVAEVTEAKAGEISQLLTEALTHNLVSVTCLRTINGNCILSHRSSSFGGRSSNDCAQRCTQGAFESWDRWWSSLGTQVHLAWTPLYKSRDNLESSLLSASRQRSKIS